MAVASARFSVCLLLTSFVITSAARPPLHPTGTGRRHHVTSTRSRLDVAGADDNPYDKTGSGNRKQRWSEVDDDAAGVGSPQDALSDGNESAGDERTQRRSDDDADRKTYGGGGGRQTRSARDIVAVGWNKRPRYYREDGSTRDWRTNMMRVWGKRNGRRAAGVARMTSAF